MTTPERDGAAVEDYTTKHVARVLAVGDTLNVLCNCGVPEGHSEATDPRDRSVRLPHHFDCAAAEAWDAIEPLIAAREAAAKAEALREAADDMPFGYSHAAALLRERADREAP